MDLATITMQTANVVRGVKPDQLDAPTPCRDWDVGTLTNHLLQVVTALDLAGRGQPVPSDLWERDLPRDDGGARLGRGVRVRRPPRLVQVPAGQVGLEREPDRRGQVVGVHIGPSGDACPAELAEEG